MLDNEVKAILEEQFSKERNYQKVINNVNRNQASYSKILKYVLLPTCGIVLAALIIPNINNDNSDYKGMAYINVIKEENKKNIVDKDNSTQIQVAEKDIYKTIDNSGEASWAYDPTIPTNLINDRIESKYVVKAKITSIGEGEILPKQENFYNPFTCHTPIQMQVIDNLLETNELSGTIKAYITGGKIKISNILENATKQEIEYMGIYDVSQVDKEKYIEYIWADPYYEPTVGDEYVIIIGKANENLYKICCGGYGIFKVEKSDGQEKYINVITNKEWKID